jgi:branched-chain amino acid transport system ATP-binding protein
MSTRSETSPVLVATQLSKRYGALQACDQVSLSVSPGEIHALIGPNGAGTSTLINGLSGAVAPDSGGLVLNGRDVTRAPMQQRVAAGLARSYQITNIFQKSSVMDN